MKIDIAKPLMKPTSRFRYPLLAVACAFSFQLAHADIITMKSGERYQGPVLSEDDSTLTIEYNLTPKIKDKKLLNKSDIKEHIRQSPAMIAMEERELAKIVPTQDLLSAAEYESIIQDKLRTFMAQFPGTPEAAEVEKMIATLGEEKERVLNGEVKMEGRWLDAATAKRDAYNIEAFRTRSAMKAAAAANVDDRYLTAMREFEKLRTQYPASIQYVAAIPEALEILDKYETLLNGMVSEQPILDKRREDGLKMLAGADLQLSKSAIDGEKAAFKSTFDQQTKSKVKWRDIYKYDIKSLETALATVAKERAELRGINLVALQAENEILSAAIRYLADGNAREAQATLGRVSKGQIVNRSALTSLERQARAAIQEDLQQQRAKTSGAVAAPVETPEEEKTEDEKMAANPVAEAMKKLQEEKEAARLKAKEEAEAKKRAREEKEAVASSPVPEEPETLMEKINPYIPYIGGGLLIVLLVAMFLGKKKKGDE
jgi:hypothetical protein